MASIVSAWKIDVSERVAASKLLASSAAPSKNDVRKACG